MTKIFEALRRAGEAPDLPVHSNGEERTRESPAAVEETSLDVSVLIDERVTGQSGPASESESQAPGIREVMIQPWDGSPILPFDGIDPRAAEQYRVIRTKIVHDSRKPQVLVVSSAQIGDGKSVNAANIAAALSLKPEVTVLLIDGDFRRSSLPQLLSLAASPGLTEVLGGKCRLADAIVRAQSPHNLYFLPTGDRPENPTELLDSRQWLALCEALRGQFSFIVVDAPPVGYVADYDLIEAIADGVILVVRPDHTNRSHCYKALAAIPKDKFLGVVVNRFQQWFLTKSFEHDYSYYSGKHA